jgi:hypothetical protein
MRKETKGMDLSILIPARNEEWLAQTVKDILEHIEGNTEVIVVCDGNWPDPPIADDPRVHLIYHSESIGQRQACNEAARLSEAEFILKCDAHCAFDQGFDVKLMEPYRTGELSMDTTTVPRMYNLHVFDWQCGKCGDRTYHAPKPTSCPKCDNIDKFEKVLVWQPRWSRCSDFARFDRTLHFQYWGGYKERPESKADIADLMCFVGACWLMPRKRFWDMDGLDEKHGSWGQMGVEISCKSWLSGGRQVVNKRTWFAHLFRTQPGFGFPYPQSGNQVKRAREHSRWLWMENRWPKAKHDLLWMIQKFAPVPEWDDYVAEAQPAGAEKPVEVPEVPDEEYVEVEKKVKQTPKAPVLRGGKPLTKGMVYYTDCRCEERLLGAVRRRLDRIVQKADAGVYGRIISVSLCPIDFGHNIWVDQPRGYLTMFRQILAGLEASRADIVFLTEHDVLYHPTHFDFMPVRDDVYYYNEHTYKVDSKTGQAVFYYTKQTSGLCAYRELLLQHYRTRVKRVEEEGFTRQMGFEPGTHSPPRGVDNNKAEGWWSKFPNVDVRHKANLTESRWDPSQFRSQRSCRGWSLVDEVPGWGVTKGRFDEFLRETEDMV